MIIKNQNCNEATEAKLQIGRKLALVNHAIKRRVEKEDTCELVRISMSNGYILMFLHDNRDRDIFQKDFEKSFGITRSTASKILALMEQKGLVTREPVPGDARLKKISLTKLGDQMRQRIIDGLKRTESQLEEGFTQQELDQLSEYLDRMRENMTRIDKTE